MNKKRKLIKKEKTIFHTFINRKIKLKGRNYKKYLKTDHWKEVKLKFRGRSCEKCGSKYKINIHHLTYRNLGRDKEYNDCVPLCEYCHQEVHAYASETNISLIIATIDFLI